MITSYDTLMQEAQRIISSAELKYESQRFHNGGEVTAQMEEEWYQAMRAAECIQAEAAREILYEQKLARDEREQESYMRRG